MLLADSALTHEESETCGLTLTVYIAIYSGTAIFLAGCVRRILQYARMPVHLRWELYPVPHEEPHRARYGGSYFESAEWWHKPQVRHRTTEWAAMFREIAFLKSLRESNQRLWIPSFIFHGGLYLSIGSIVLTAIGAVPGLLFAKMQPPILLTTMLRTAVWIGVAGEILVLIGASLLLVRRVRDAELRNYTKPADVFNLVFFVVTFALLVAGTILESFEGASFKDTACGILSFDAHLKMNGVLGAGLILASALAAYIPFTHMAHFIAKYFTWHSVRWDDRRMEIGSRMETELAAVMRLRPNWSASHIGGGAENSWAEVATADPVREIKK